MKTSFIKALLLIPLLFIGSTLSAQIALDHTTFITIGNTATWTDDDGLVLGAGDNPVNTSVTHNKTLQGTTYSTVITGGSSNNGNATIELGTFSPTFSSKFTNSSTYTGRVWISFAADTNSTDGWSNLKLLQNGSSNSSIVVGVGDVTGNHMWGVGYGPESGGTTTSSSPFSPTSTLGSSRSDMTNKSFILMQIDYNAGTNNDVLSVWRSNTSFSLDSHGAPTNLAGLGSALVTRTNDFNFDRLSIYAGSGASLYLSNITLTSEIPEPSSYAVLLGLMTIGFVAFRQYRRRSC